MRNTAFESGNGADVTGNPIAPYMILALLGFALFVAAYLLRRSKRQGHVLMILLGTLAACVAVLLWLWPVSLSLRADDGVPLTDQGVIGNRQNGLHPKQPQEPANR